MYLSCLFKNPLFAAGVPAQKGAEKHSFRSGAGYTVRKAIHISEEDGSPPCNTRYIIAEQAHGSWFEL